MQAVPSGVDDGHDDGLRRRLRCAWHPLRGNISHDLGQHFFRRGRHEPCRPGDPDVVRCFLIAEAVPLCVDPGVRYRRLGYVYADERANDALLEASETNRTGAAAYVQ